MLGLRVLFLRRKFVFLAKFTCRPCQDKDSVDSHESRPWGSFLSISIQSTFHLLYSDHFIMFLTDSKFRPNILPTIPHSKSQKNSHLRPIKFFVQQSLNLYRSIAEKLSLHSRPRTPPRLPHETVSKKTTLSALVRTRRATVHRPSVPPSPARLDYQ